MDKILDLIIELQGIIGTRIGTISTLLVTDILRKCGGLKIYIMEFVSKLKSKNNFGESVDWKPSMEIDYLDFKYKLHIYNKSDVPTIMRNFKVKFFNGKKEVYSMTPEDIDTERCYAGGFICDKPEVLNIPSKEIIVINHKGYINKDNLYNINNTTKVVLSYLNQKNKKKNIVLSRDKIELM